LHPKTIPKIRNTINHNSFSMKKPCFYACLIAAMALMSACDPVKPEIPDTTYYQCDSTVERTTDGEEVQRYEYKYDAQGNIVWEYWFYPAWNHNFINENTYDAQGRLTRQIAYWEGNGNHELSAVYDFSYSTNAQGQDYRLLVCTDPDGDVYQIDSTIFDPQGRKLQDCVFYPDGEGGFYIDYTNDFTYDEQGNCTRSVFVAPYDPDYYYETRYTYEYQTFGELTQYTLKEVQYSWDGISYAWDSRFVLSYDSVGNNISELSYYPDDNGVLQFSARKELTVFYEIPCAHTYGVELYTPQQPHCYDLQLTYLEDGTLYSTRHDYYSVHHVANASSSAPSPRRLAPSSPRRPLH